MMIKTEKSYNHQSNNQTFIQAFSEEVYKPIWPWNHPSKKHQKENTKHRWIILNIIVRFIIILGYIMVQLKCKCCWRYDKVQEKSRY